MSPRKQVQGDGRASHFNESLLPACHYALTNTQRMNPSIPSSLDKIQFLSYSMPFHSAPVLGTECLFVQKQKSSGHIDFGKNSSFITFHIFFSFSLLP